MKLYDLLTKICTCFNRFGIPYMVVGSVAAIAYGEARYTNDVDIVADIKRENIPDILSCFSPDEYYLSEDSIKDAVFRKFQFNIIHPASGLKADIVIKKKDEFDNERFSRIVNIKLDGVGVNFAAPEDVIIKKMHYYKMGGSEKHLRDITGMIKVSEELIRFEYIETWSSKLNLTEIWEAIKKRLQNKK